MVLGGHLVELLESDVLSGEDGCEDVPSVGGDGVTVSGVDFSDKAVGPEHAKLTGNPGGTTARFLRGIGGRGVEKGLEVSVAESVDCEFASADGFKECGVFFRPRAECPNALAVPSGRLTETTNHLSHREGGVHGGEGIEVTFVGRLRHLNAPIDIGHSFSHGEPAFGAGGLILCMAIDFEVVGLIDGCFHAKDGPLFVVDFDRILSEAMFNANPFGAIFEIGDDFALERPVNLAT